MKKETVVTIVKNEELEIENNTEENLLAYNHFIEKNENFNPKKVIEAAERIIDDNYYAENWMLRILNEIELRIEKMNENPDNQGSDISYGYYRWGFESVSYKDYSNLKEYPPYEFKEVVRPYAEGVKDAHYKEFLEKRLKNWYNENHRLNNETFKIGDLSTEECNKISHSVVLLQQLGITGFLKKEYADFGLKTNLRVAQLIGTIINRTSSSEIETIRKANLYYGIKNEKNPNNDQAKEKIKQILEKIKLDSNMLASKK